MKALVLGSGAQGRVISTYLAQDDAVGEVRLADLNHDMARRHVGWLKNSKVSAHKVDAGDFEEVAKLAKGMDVVVNAVIPRYNLNVLRATYKAGSHYQDMAFGPPYRNLDRQLEHSEQWKDAGLTALTATGGSPGITNVLAAQGADLLDTTTEIRFRAYGVVKAKKPVFFWSPRTMLEDFIHKPCVYRNGKQERVDPFAGEETYVFPPPLGPQKVHFHAHEEPYSIPHFMNDELRYVDYKSGSPSALTFRNLYELGLLSEEPISVKGMKIAPLSVVLSALPSPPTMEEISALLDQDVIEDVYSYEVVEAIGTRNGFDTKVIYHVCGLSLRDAHNRMRVATDLSYSVGISAAIFTRMLGTNQIKTLGVLAPEALKPDTRQEYLRQLGLHDIKIRQHIETAVS